MRGCYQICGWKALISIDHLLLSESGSARQKVRLPVSKILPGYLFDLIDEQ
jgi:hypothetical protein